MFIIYYVALSGNECMCYFLTEVVRITQDNAELTRIIEELSKSSVSVVWSQLDACT